MVADVLDNLKTQGVLDESTVAQVRSLWASGQSLDEAIRQAPGVDEQAMLDALSRQFGVPLVQLDDELPPRELVSRYPARVLLQHQLLPLSEDDQSVLVATSRAFDTRGLDELRLMTDKDVRIALAPQAAIERALKKMVGVGADTLESMASDRDGLELVADLDTDDVDLEEAAHDASIIRFVNQVLTEAIGLRATDVHFEPFEDELRVRYRVDGVLVEANIPSSVARYRPAIVSRLKILGHLDIAEKRLPQDGRIRLRIAGREVDVRVSVIPMLHGEAVVLRILDRSATLLDLSHLGMSDRDTGEFARALDLPHGIILVTGPTGSGKTTTLYAGLSRINVPDTKIITIEDPIEYQLHGINQIQVSEKAGLTFAAGLRAILRHDPDVVLIGEIRDRETAQIAVQASLTGHLVLSTLHTNDAPSAVTRLIEMGVEPYLVASSLELVLAQRLVRLICKHCKAPMPREDHHRVPAELVLGEGEDLYVGTGCQHCAQTGFRGRKGVFEMMPVTEALQGLTLRRASSGQIRRVAVEEGMMSLREDGLRQVRMGLTTLDEVMRVTKDERSTADDRSVEANWPTSPEGGR